MGRNADEPDPGEIPLVSCTDYDDRIIRTCDIPLSEFYANIITTAHNGQPLTKYLPLSLGVRDDMALLIPKENLRLSTMMYVVYALTRQKCRYSYLIPSIR
jgi:hypothetical protein